MYGIHREKTCLWGFRQSKTKTSLLSYRDLLEIRNAGRSEPRYFTLQKGNNKGTDQSARMRRLVCAFVVHKPPKTGFFATRRVCCFTIFNFLTLLWPWQITTILTSQIVKLR